MNILYSARQNWRRIFANLLHILEVFAKNFCSDEGLLAACQRSTVALSLQSINTPTGT